MSLKLRLLARDLKKLENAYNKLARGIPSPGMAESVADQALDRVLTRLLDDELVSTLDNLIRETRESLDTKPDKVDKKSTQTALELEAKILREYGLRFEDVVEFFAIVQEIEHDHGKLVSDTKELRESLKSLHEHYKAEIRGSREDTRKLKKKRKRKVLQGAASATVGTIVIAVDISHPPLFPLSFSLGGGALLQAMRDLIGDPPE
jgi:hypothetical protein